MTARQVNVVRPLESRPPNQAEQTAWMFELLRNKLQFSNYSKHAGLYKILLSDHLGLLVGMVDIFKDRPSKAQVYKDEFMILRDSLITLLESLLLSTNYTAVFLPGSRKKLKAYRDELKSCLRMLRDMHYTTVNLNAVRPARTGMKYCMSHLGWIQEPLDGLCRQCGSAMLENEDMT